MRKFYTLLLYLVLPFILLRLIWKSYKLPAYRRRISERFCLNKPKQVDIWLHAVSLGEVVAATPLIERFIEKQCAVLVTTMTPTGSAYIKKRFEDKIEHQYVPYDFPLVVKNFFKKARPKIGIIMETELWPNLIHGAYISNIPLYLVNARISDRAFKQYKMFDFFFKSVLNEFTAILAQSEGDAKRFIDLGAKAQKVENVGNVKFDLNPILEENPKIKQLKALWGGERVVVIAASTHDNEEKQWLEYLPRLQKEIPNMLLILVPRHPERFKIVFELCNKMGFKTALRSQPESISITTDIVIVDAMGELMHFYRMANFAFVGGSLVPIGGHNVLEPISVGVPVLCGPYMNNSKAICEALTTEKALIIADNIEDLIKYLLMLYKNKDLRETQIANASKLLLENRGVVDRYIQKILL